MLTDLFFKINFSISIIASIFGLILSIITIFTISFERQLHSVTNLLTCNTSLAVGLYLIFSLIASIYGLNEKWSLNQPACQFRAYIFVVSCTALLYSHSIHAISRLFFVIFHKYRYLLTWRIHWILVIISWVLGIFLPIEPFFFNNGYIYENESRLCTCTTKTTLTATYIIITAFIIPFNIVTIIYSLLICHAHKSTRRVRPIQSNIIVPPNIGREIILIRNMTILLFILLGGGIPYLILVIWNGIKINNPPEYLYLLIINSITICTALMMLLLFTLNKDLKKKTYNFFKKFYLN